jgi:hypothetical protein
MSINPHFGHMVARRITREMLKTAEYYNIELIDIEPSDAPGLIWFNFTGAANSVAKFKQALRNFPECQNL